MYFGVYTCGDFWVFVFGSVNIRGIVVVWGLFWDKVANTKFNGRDFNL